MSETREEGNGNSSTPSDACLEKETPGLELLLAGRPVRGRCAHGNRLVSEREQQTSSLRSGRTVLDTNRADSFSAFHAWKSALQQGLEPVRVWPALPVPAPPVPRGRGACGQTAGACSAAFSAAGRPHCLLQGPGETWRKDCGGNAWRPRRSFPSLETGQGSRPKQSWGGAGRAGRGGALLRGDERSKGCPGWLGSDCKVLGALWPLSSGRREGGVSAVCRHSGPRY